MENKQLVQISERFLDAWNTQDVDKVLACYTDDLVYLGPNTHGEIRTPQAMRRYLTKLFSVWKMHWSLRDAHAFKDMNGAAVRWHATFQRVGGEKVVEADGMDFVVLDGERVKRNEVYFDRAALTALLE